MKKKKLGWSIGISMTNAAVAATVTIFINEQGIQNIKYMCKQWEDRMHTQMHYNTSCSVFEIDTVREKAWHCNVACNFCHFYIHFFFLYLSQWDSSYARLIVFVCICCVYARVCVTWFTGSVVMNIGMTSEQHIYRYIL